MWGVVRPLPHVDMNSHHIENEVKSFLDLSVSARHHNTVYSTVSLAAVLCLAAWAGHSITDVAGAPSTDTVFYWMESSIERLDAVFRRFVEKVLRQHPKYWKRHTPYLLIDETHESYSGKLLWKKHPTPKEKDMLRYIHGYKPKRGDTGSFRFLTFALVGPTKKLIVRSVPVLADDGCKHSDGKRHAQDCTPLIIETLLWVRKQVRFKLAIFDRGFYDEQLIKRLKEERIPYLIRARLSKTMLEMIKGMTTTWAATPYLVGQTASHPGEATTLVLGKDKDQPWALITNRLPEQAWRLRHYYRKRWNIENIFQVCDGINIHTNSTEIEKKLMCFLLSCLIYNIWQHARERTKGMTLRTFTRKMNHQLEELRKGKGPPLQLSRSNR